MLLIFNHNLLYRFPVFRGRFSFIFLKIRLKFEMLLNPHRNAISLMEFVVSNNIFVALLIRMSLM